MEEFIKQVKSASEFLANEYGVKYINIKILENEEGKKETYIECGNQDKVITL